MLTLLGLVPGGAVGRARRLGRGAFVLDSLVALVARPLRGKPVAVRTGPARGLQLRVEPRSLAWLTGKVEPEVQRALQERLRPGDTVVDAGASIGFHSLLAGRLVGPGGTVVAFEPNPPDAASVRANADLNGLANVVVVEEALSSASATAFLDRPGEATARLRRTATPGALQVQTTSLDAYLTASRLAPAVVKIDVEGHEAEVIEGMAATLARSRPVLIVEMHGDRAFLAQLELAGYRCDVLGPFPSVEHAPWWAHVLAVPRGG